MIVYFMALRNFLLAQAENFSAAPIMNKDNYFSWENRLRVSPHGVTDEVLDCDILVTEFDLRHAIAFTFGKVWVK